MKKIAFYFAVAVLSILSCTKMDDPVQKDDPSGEPGDVRYRLAFKLAEDDMGRVEITAASASYKADVSAGGVVDVVVDPASVAGGIDMRFFDRDSCFVGEVKSLHVSFSAGGTADLGVIDSRIEYAPRIGIIHYGSSDTPLTVFKNCLNDAGARLIKFDRYATSTSIAESQVKSVDAIIEPGSTAKDTASRSTYDNRVVKAARKLGRPILGICYGHQRVNTVLGGVTKSVAEYYPESTIKHKLSIGGRNVGLHDAAYFHKITIDKTSKLYELLGAEEAMVNTSHNYSVYSISDSLRVVAKSPDGVVEALEGERFLGVQFHPEYLYGELHIAQFLPIFRYLVEMAEDARNNNYYM